MASGFTYLFFNISGGEIFIILLIVFLVFGPAKIPEIARSLGRMMNEVKKASSDISREFRKETSAIERDIRKTGTDLSKDLDVENEEKSRKTDKKSHPLEDSEIPDVYLTNADKESESHKPDDTGEKSGDPIQ